MSSITMMDIRLALEDHNLEGLVGEKRRTKPPSGRRLLLYFFLGFEKFRRKQVHFLFFFPSFYSSLAL